jgi:predicted protein tyrosine phosphatase
MNVLFICTYNQWRSLTAEKLFSGRPGISVKSAGISQQARIRLTPAQLEWADLVFVMEERHLEYIRSTFPGQAQKKRVICLNIPSGYRLNDPELIDILEEAVAAYF